MNLSEKDARLRYFYLQDTEALTQNIAEKWVAKTHSSPMHIFDIIYSEIKKTCEPYSRFVTSGNSFNNPEKYDEALTSITFFHHEILKNHCILHGFFNAVNEAGAKEKEIKISSANDYILKQGYFKTNHFDKKTFNKDVTESGEAIAQKYNQHKRRFNSNLFFRSYSILKKYDCGSDNFINTQRHNGNWSCFIYTNPKVYTLDKNIKEHKAAPLNHYSALLDECILWGKGNNLSSEDRVLFEHKMESLYGFSFSIYAAQLFARMYVSPSHKDTITLKSLEGDTMRNLIQETAQIPILYNRSFFLEYAIRSVLASKYLRTHEFQHSPNALFSHTPDVPISKDLLVLSGLNDIIVYLKKLKFLVPLLEDLWDVITDKLNRTLDIPINLDVYRSYIHSNYSRMAQNYSRFLNDEQALQQFNKESFLHTDSFKEEDMLYKKYCFEDSLSPKYARESFEEFLLNYFANAEQTSGKLTNLYDRAKLYPHVLDNNSISKYTNELNFRKSHVENILYFAKIIT